LQEKLQDITCPPSMLMACPVTPRASSEASRAIAEAVLWSFRLIF